MRLMSMVVVLVALAGCKATERDDSGFLSRPDQLDRHKDKPFHGWWANKDADWASAKKVFVAEVDLTHLDMHELQNVLHLASVTALDLEAKRMGQFMRRKVREAFRADPAKRFEVTDRPGPNTLSIELALVQLVPTRNVLNLASYVILWMPIDWGAVAIEGRMRLGKSGPVVAKFKDKEYGQMAIFSVADLFWFSHAKKVIRDWAEQLVGCAKLESVDDTYPFTLQPW